MLCRNAKAWIGMLPDKMLETLIRPEIATTGPLLECHTDGAQWQCSGLLTLLGDEAPLTAAAENCPSDDTARQQVALQLLHQYQARLLQLFACTAACPSLNHN